MFWGDVWARLLTGDSGRVTPAAAAACCGVMIGGASLRLLLVVPEVGGGGFGDIGWNGDSWPWEYGEFGSCWE